MNKEVRDALEVDRRFRILNYVLSGKKVLSQCREFGIPRSTFYRWKAAYEKGGKEGLFRKKPVAKSHPRQIPADYVEKILHLRTQYHLGPQRIAWYL
jgi:transposase-like protein